MTIKRLTLYSILICFSHTGLAQQKIMNGCELRKYANCPFVDLSGVNLNGINLKGANLQGANLSGATLRNANLTGANLSYSMMTSVDLTKANLREANLNETILDSSTLAKANLKGATLHFAQLNGANLSKVKMQGADLYGARVVGSDLTGSVLKGADFTNVETYGAKISSSDLNGVSTGTSAPERENPDKSFMDFFPYKYIGDGCYSYTAKPELPVPGADWESISTKYCVNRSGLICSSVSLNGGPYDGQWSPESCQSSNWYVEMLDSILSSNQFAKVIQDEYPDLKVDATEWLKNTFRKFFELLPQDIELRERATINGLNIKVAHNKTYAEHYRACTASNSLCFAPYFSSDVSPAGSAIRYEGSKIKAFITNNTGTSVYCSGNAYGSLNNGESISVGISGTIRSYELEGKLVSDNYIATPCGNSVNCPIPRWDSFQLDLVCNY